MPKICYENKRFNAEHEAIILEANRIIANYATQGYDLTLRQLYYQFVSRDLFPQSWAAAATGSTNNERSYKKLGTIISDARRAGRIDWDSIVDRTRFMRNPPYWSGPSAIVKAGAAQFDVDWWENQKYRPEVWVEKDALIGVLEVACRRWHCPYFSCRGYASDSEIWAAGRRFRDARKRFQTPVVIHLGDHDPSGIDMTRDIEDRLKMFSGGEVKVIRVALNMDQVEQYDPPPNPAKTTDSRYEGYNRLHGDESWELDALSPEVLSTLIGEAINNFVNEDDWNASEGERDEGRRKLQAVSDNWDDLTEKL